MSHTAFCVVEGLITKSIPLEGRVRPPVAARAAGAGAAAGRHDEGRPQEAEAERGSANHDHHVAIHVVGMSKPSWSMYAVRGEPGTSNGERTGRREDELKFLKS